MVVARKQNSDDACVRSASARIHCALKHPHCCRLGDGLELKVEGYSKRGTHKQSDEREIIRKTLDRELQEWSASFDVTRWTQHTPVHSEPKQTPPHRWLWSRQNWPGRTSRVQGLGLRGRLCSLFLGGRWSGQFILKMATSSWYSLEHRHDETRFDEAETSGEDRIPHAQYAAACSLVPTASDGTTHVQIMAPPLREQGVNFHQCSCMMRARPLRTSRPF